MHAAATAESAAAPAAAPRPAHRRAGHRLPARLLRLAGDDRLVEQVRAGSAAAFEVAFDRHHRGVLAFCRHMLGSVEEAEDAVQHTFMAAYRHLANSAQPVHLRPWLYAIARNRCLSVLRARREQPVEVVVEPATEHLAGEVERREDLRALLRDIARLPDDQRAALVLAEIGDVSHDQIALVLSCPRDKVKALVFQARTSLNASRTAREASCVDIRRQLANLHGGSLRRNLLRRHLRECAGCRDFRQLISDQRRALAIVLPVDPSVGLKEAVLGSVLGGGAAVGAGGAAGVGAVVAGSSAVGTTGAGAGGTGLAAKALVVAAVAGGGGAAGVEALREPRSVRPLEAQIAFPSDDAHAAVVPHGGAAATAGGREKDAPARWREASSDPASSDAGSAPTATERSADGPPITDPEAPVPPGPGGGGSFPPAAAPLGGALPHEPQQPAETPPDSGAPPSAPAPHAEPTPEPAAGPDPVDPQPAATPEPVDPEPAEEEPPPPPVEELPGGGVPTPVTTPTPTDPDEVGEPPEEEEPEPAPTPDPGIE